MVKGRIVVTDDDGVDHVFNVVVKNMVQNFIQKFLTKFFKPFAKEYFMYNTATEAFPQVCLVA